ncbi:hypothetical protein VNI00_013644 [Paramarasmius palmivorus]|uniref:Uncharacterized protein n=1 Tax=Paramarasmius palmivorus TaxID=297713 RepID=A0AAW0BV04_9AGAR
MSLQNPINDGSTLARPISVPPSSGESMNRDSGLGIRLPSVSSRPASAAPQQSKHHRNFSSPSYRAINTGASLDLMGHLQRSGPAIVKTRRVSFVMWSVYLNGDESLAGRALDLDLNVHGAPNFRAPRQGDLNVFGVAQPRTQGLRAILSVLRCRPGIQDPSHVVWFSTREEPIVYISGRPFVLRDASQPRRTLSISDRAENLEAIEMRLKNDILQEATRYGGLVLTHNEVASDSGEGAILPTWTAVDTNNVKTSRELWTYMKNEGWNVDDNYLDAYLNVIKTTDPHKTSLVFSCGMGAMRTTYAMVAACIVRRKRVMEQGWTDPFGLVGSSTFNAAGNALKGTNTPLSRSDTPPIMGVSKSGVSTPSNSQIQMSMEQASAQQDLSRSLLRLTYLLQQTLQEPASHSAIELLMTNPTLLENLRKAFMGNYGIILSLLGCLDHGVQAKKLVDKVIDSNDHVLNIREDILVERMKYSLTSMEEEKGEAFLNRAGKSLEK